MVIIGQKTLREKLGIDVTAQMKASVLKAQGRQNGAGMELTARSVGEPNDGAVLRVAIAVIAFVLGGDAPGDVDDEVTLTLPCQRSMIFQDSDVETRNRVGVLETAVDNAVDHSSSPECAKMLRYIVFRTHLDVSCRALPGNPHVHAKGLGRSGFIQGQGRCGRNPHLNVIACGGVRQSCAPTAIR